jgi:hypothetical protein
MKMRQGLKRHIGLFACASIAAFQAFEAASAAQPQANTLLQLFTNLKLCLSQTEGPVGSQLTLRFSLRRDGSVFGTPRVAYAHFTGDEDASRRFVARALAALNGCVPFGITPGLGGAIAGRPIAIRVIEQRAHASAEVVATLPAPSSVAFLQSPPREDDAPLVPYVPELQMPEESMGVVGYALLPDRPWERRRQEIRRFDGGRRSRGAYRAPNR